MTGGNLTAGPDKLLGRVLNDRYRIEQLLGEGGFAVVYRAEHLELERPVAVKVLRDGFADTDELRARFAREAKAMAGLVHPNIVSVMDYGVAADGTPYLVMELLPGRNLRAVLDADRTLGPARAIAVTRQILRAVAFAHERGVLHRDLKPGNVFLQELPDTVEHVKLLDFGFAKFVEAEAGLDGQPLTRAGRAFGTPAYMAPEQALQKEPDGRIDIYGTGVMLFEMLVGHKPFPGDAGEQLRTKMREEPPRLSAAMPEQWVAPELDAVLAKALARNPADRFGTAREFLAALDTIPAQPIGARATLEPRTSSVGARRPRAAVLLAALSIPALVVLGVCGGVGAWLLLGRDGPQDEGTAVASGPNTTTASDLAFTLDEAIELGVADPWTTRPMPPLLGSVHEAVAAGEDVEDEVLRALRRDARERPGDGRAQVVIGHVYAARGWRRDALSHYEEGAREDPAVRGDRRMLANLLAMATTEAVGDAAAAAVERIYGAEALEALDAARRHPRIRPAGERRLDRLRARLSR